MIDELEKIIFDLISFETQNQNLLEINKCILYIKNYFNGTDYICEVNESNGVQSLFIHKKDCGKLDCIFSGHIDVVPADDSQFKPFIKDNKIFGRGAIDMKSQVGTIIYFIKHYQGNKKIGALITSDEEIGGFNGTPKALSKFKINANVAIVPDGGYNFQLVNSERGVLQLEINVTGLSVHSSKEPEGINAIVRAVELYSAIKDHLNIETANCQTVNLASLSTDNNVYNKVPDKAKMLIDIRYNKQCNINYVYELLDNCNYVEYSIYAKANPFYCDTTNIIIKKYIDVCQKVLQREIEVIEFSAAADARYFTDMQIPTIIMNPNGQEMHGKNEAIEIESIGTLLNIYENFVKEL